MNLQSKKVLENISNDPIKSSTLIVGKSLMLLELAKWGREQAEHEKAITHKNLQEWTKLKTKELETQFKEIEAKGVKK
jgi:hypothetical protein